MRAMILALVLSGCAAQQVAPPAPTPPKPAHAIPPDVQLICHQGQWVVVSQLAEMAAIFDASCGPNA